jgi:hypothetical protein
MFDPRIPVHAWHLACRRNILVEFRDFDDYLDEKVDFLVNGGILAALDSPAVSKTIGA